MEEAAGWAAQGFGVKPCIGRDYRSDMREVEDLRRAMGDDATLLVDAMWGYTLPDALCAARVFQEVGVGFLESPLAPEDIDGHVRLADALDMPIAVGEPLRTRYQFLPWIGARAMDIVQPDVMRNGITETVAVTELAVAHHLPVALHTGVVTVVGMAATTQIASALPNFHLQEVQPVMLETFKHLASQPIELRDGAVVVPKGPGIGIEVDEECVREMSTQVVTVGL
jgi:galactonate dehydratase